jgi:DNA-binding transcriptional regulator WhiA
MMANNPRWAEVSADTNQARASQAGRQQAVLARRAVAVLAAQAQTGVHVQRWIQALQLRIDHPDSTLADLAHLMDPPLTKHAYAALLRRALRAGGIGADDTPTEPVRGD